MLAPGLKSVLNCRKGLIGHPYVVPTLQTLVSNREKKRSSCTGWPWFILKFNLCFIQKYRRMLLLLQGCTHHFVHQGHCKRNASVVLAQQPVVLQVANTAGKKAFWKRGTGNTTVKFLALKHATCLQFLYTFNWRNWVTMLVVLCFRLTQVK